MRKGSRSQLASNSAKPRNAAESAPSVANGVARADQELVSRAYRKVMAKEELTRPERQALTRHEKAQEEKRRWQYYRSIPQKHWRAMSGRTSCWTDWIICCACRESRSAAMMAPIWISAMTSVAAAITPRNTSDQPLITECLHRRSPYP